MTDVHYAVVISVLSFVSIVTIAGVDK